MFICALLNPAMRKMTLDGTSQGCGSSSSSLALYSSQSALLILAWMLLWVQNSGCWPNWRRRNCVGQKRC